MGKGKASTTLLSCVNAGIITKQVATETRGVLAGQAELLLSPVQWEEVWNMTHYLISELSWVDGMLGQWDKK